jgi:acylpyruvate hydrolase
MKLASLLTRFGEIRIGAALEHRERIVLVDLKRAYTAYLSVVEGETRAVALSDARISQDMRLFLEGGERSMAAARQALRYTAERLERAGEEQSLQDTGFLHDEKVVKFLPPVPRPGKVISVGANYRKHLEEFNDKTGGKAFSNIAAQLGKANYPPAFSILPSTLVGHDADVIYPSYTKQFDYEAELAFVIGKRCKNVPPENYLDVVAGFTIFNDLSMRDLQAEEMKRGLLLMGKNLDTTNSVGPYLVTKDEIPDPMSLQISCWVNGDRRQHASTSDMVFNIAQIVSYYSRMTLEPGDMFTTGSPSGVGITSATPELHLLKPGDVVEVGIERLGRLKNKIVPEAIAR